jgi:hypothetical protein
MTMRELIDKLLEEEKAIESEGYNAEAFNLVGYVLGEGLTLDIDGVFLDGTSLHLDWKVRR